MERTLVDKLWFLLTMAPLGCAAGPSDGVDGVSGGGDGEPVAPTTGEATSSQTTAPPPSVTTSTPPGGSTGETGLVEETSTGIEFTSGDGSSSTGPGTILSSGIAGSDSSSDGSSSTGAHFCESPPETPCQEYACHLIDCYDESFIDADERLYNCETYVDSLTDEYCISAVEELLSCIGEADCDELSAVGLPDVSPCPDVAQNYADSCF